MATVETVCVDSAHNFSKSSVPAIRLIAGEGVEGDAHRGVTVKHRSRVKKDPTQPNLRQVHLISGELLDELRESGFSVNAGTLGENITTRGIALLELSRGTRLGFGEAEIEITGLRNPCGQIENYEAGLLKSVLSKDDAGNLIRRAGVMAIVVKGGEVTPGMTISTTAPPQHLPLEVV